MKIAIWKKPFLYLSGSDFATLRQCPPENVTRYSLLGSLVLIPAIMGFCSASFALSFVFTGNDYIFIVSTIWAFIILTIDRSIVAYNPEIFDNETEKVFGNDLQEDLKKKSKNKGIVTARIIISIVLGFVVAEPLCLEIFNDVISEQIEAQSKATADNAIRPLDSLINNAEQRRNTARDNWLEKRDAAQGEADGTRGTGIRNPGPIYKEALRLADEYEVEYKKIDSLERIYIDSIKKEIYKQQTAKKQANGLLGKIEALHDASNEKGSLFISTWMLRLFLILIELVPLVLKSALKRKSDAYVLICHHNNLKVIELNRKEENNIVIKKMLQSIIEDIERTNQILKKQKIKNIAKDFHFYLKINQYATKTFQRKCGIIEQAITDQEMRKNILGRMAKSYEEFIVQLNKTYQKSENGSHGEG